MAYQRTVTGALEGLMAERRARGLERVRAQPWRRCRGPYLERAGRRCLSFLSNDYLGLSQDETWREAAARAFAGHAPSGTGSRLVCGWDETASEAERAFARRFGRDECLFFPSGCQGSLALMTCLVRRGQPVLVDRRIHASAALALATTGCRVLPYAHGDMGHLERRLQSLDDAWQPVVVTESLFSMDGTVSDARAFDELRARYGFFLIVDEAHALGCLGENGAGVFYGHDADVVLGTMGKGLGFFGAFALMPEGFARCLENLAAPVMFSTALPPAHAACCLELAARLPGLAQRREKLAGNAAFFRRVLSRRGFSTLGQAHVVALPVGSEARAMELSRSLEERGVLAFAARHPTVPFGRALLRFSLTSMHDRAMLERTAYLMLEAAPDLRDQ